MRVWVSNGGVGGLIENAKAGVSALDHGLTVGDGVFETVKVETGQPIALSRHLARLASSCRILGLSEPDEDHVRSAISDVLNANSENSALARLRVTVTAGEAPLGSDRGDARPTLIVALAAMKPWPESTSALVLPWVRNERSPVTGAKTTSYADNVVALSWSNERGFSEGLFLNTIGRLCEGTGSNVFVVLRDQVVTPPLGSGCLAGITRQLILDLGLAVEQDVTVEDIHAADEVFLTSSTRDVHPVTVLGERTWPDAGRLSRHCLSVYRDAISKNPDP